MSHQPEVAAEVAGPSDAELITAVRSGDTAAFATLFTRHSAAARGLARSLARDHAEADDLVSESFTKILQILRDGGGPDTAFRPYLYTTLRRVAYDRTRANQRVQPTDNLAAYDPGVPFVDPALAGLEKSIVAKAFASLPERWQAVLWHTEVEGLTPAQVGPLLGLTANGVSALAYRAREGLRQSYLQQHLAGPVSMECREVHPLLGAYARGGLSKREQSQVDDHLEHCAKCRALVLELTDVSHGMRAVIAPIILGTAGLAALKVGALTGGTAAAAAAGGSAGTSTGGGTAASGGSGAGTTGAGATGAGATAGAGAGAAGVAAAVAAPLALAARIVQTVGTGAGAAAAGAVAAAVAGVLIVTTVFGGGDNNSTLDAGGPSPRAVSSAPSGPQPSGSADAPSAPGSSASPDPSIAPSTAPTDGPASTPQPSDGAGPTSGPSSTPEPTSGPDPTTNPTATPQPTTTPEPTRTPQPTATPTSTPQPTASPQPTATPQPTPTPPPVPRDLLALRLEPLGDLVAGREGVIGFSVDAPADEPLTGVTAQLSLPNGVSLVGTVVRPGSGMGLAALRVAPYAVSEGWFCAGTTVSVTCTGPDVPAGGEASLFLKVFAGAGSAGTTPISVTVSATGAKPVTVTGSRGVQSTGLPARWAGHGGLGVTEVGSNLLSCPATSTGCAQARLGLGTRTNNNDWTLVPVDSDLLTATANSSRATLAVPAGSTISYAGLFWSAHVPSGTSDSTLGSAVLQAPDGTTYDLSADDVQHADMAFGPVYQSFADVTEIVAAKGAGSWTVGDVALVAGSNKYAGWSLVVVYDDPSATEGTVSVYDGLAAVDTGRSPTFDVPTVAGARARIGMVAWEGDAAGRGDSLLIDGHKLTPLAGRADVDNVADSTAAGAPDPNTFGVDAKPLSGVTFAGDTATVRALSTDEVWVLGVLTVSST